MSSCIRRRFVVVMSVAIGLFVLPAFSACEPASTVGAVPTATPTSASSLATASPGNTPAPVMSASWTQVIATPSHTADLMVAPSRAQVIYLCADDGPAVSPLPATSRVYKSTDGGQTWQRLSTAPHLTVLPDGGVTPLPECNVFVDVGDANDLFFQQIELDPQGAGHAISKEFARSRDGGATWQQLGTMTATDGFNMIAVLGTRLIAQPHPSVLGARPCDPSVTPKPSSKVYASDDGGMTWHDLGGPIESQGYSPHDFAIAGSVLFASSDKVPANPCSSQVVVSRLWKSADGGASWVSVATPQLPLGPLSFTPKASGSGYYGIASAYAYQSGSNTLTPLFSSDSGATWSSLPVLAHPETGSGLVVAPSGAVLTDMNTSGQVDIVRPGTAAATWTTYAPDSDTTASYGARWQLVPGPGTGTIWSVSAAYGGPSLIEHLPLP